MSNEEQLTPAEAELAHALGGLRPAGGMDRDRVLFRAGAASARRTGRLGVGLAAALAAALAVSLAVRPKARVIERVVTVPAPPAAPATAATWPAGPSVWTLTTGDGKGAYLALRDQVLTKGLDALPAPAPAAGMPAERPDGLGAFRRPPLGFPKSLTLSGIVNLLWR